MRNPSQRRVDLGRLEEADPVIVAKGGGVS